MVWNSREDEAALYGSGSSESTTTSTRRKITIAFIVLLLVGILLAIIVPVTLNARNRSNDSVPGQQTGPSPDVTTACSATQYPDTCSTTLRNSTHSNAKIFTSTTVTAASDGLDETRLSVKNSQTPENAPAVQVCMETLSSASSELEVVLQELNTTDMAALKASFDDIKTRLTAAMEFHTTCLDALEEVGGPISPAVLEISQKTKEIFSVALSFVNAFAAFGDNFLAWARSAGMDMTQFNHRGRRLLDDEIYSIDEKEGTDEKFPLWVGMEQRRHLLQTVPANGTYNVTVAWNGSGKYRKIMDAVRNAPVKSTKPYVIYIKSGIYKEQVKINSSLTNIMFLGDGPTYTIITGSLSVALTKNMTTFLSPTLIVEGKGFMAKGIQVRNTAGANGHQAVAMRVSADNTAFHLCTFDSFQDTLYVHNYRQYYRDCTIMGTIDYIFGNAWAVFQNCRLTAKKSTIAGQVNVYTAQGKTDSGQSTGISFQSCTFDATADLARNSKSFPTFLGRPWKAYATTILLRSRIQAHVDPKGWLPWNTSDFGLKTSNFAEFQSSGPGALPSSRVPWSKQIKTLTDANKYQASVFILGNSWVPATKFPYTGALLK